MAKQRGLGKGLASLIPAADAETANAAANVSDAQLAEKIDGRDHAPSMMKIDYLRPNPSQPRKNIDEDLLKNLADSISEHGIIQPILVRPFEGAFQIVAGERRWRAAKLLNMSEVPVRVLELDDAKTMELALVENLQREDLSATEIALGIQEMITKLSLTHEQAAEKLGMSRAAVTNKLRILQLPQVILAMIEDGSITEGHARALLALPSQEKMIDFANRAVEKNLNVRQLEMLVKNAEEAERINAALPPKPQEPPEFENEITNIQNSLKFTVRVAGNRKNMGLLIKGMRKWQVQMVLEYIQNNVDELFPRE